MFKTRRELLSQGVEGQEIEQGLASRCRGRISTPLTSAGCLEKKNCLILLNPEVFLHQTFKRAPVRYMCQSVVKTLERAKRMMPASTLAPTVVP